MKFSLNQIKKDAVYEPLMFDEELDVSELEKLNNDIRQIKPVQVKGLCTLEKDEVIFSFTITGEMTLPCARTLVDVPYRFNIKALEIFTTSQAKLGEDKEDIHLITDEVIDLTPYIKENILLETPYRVFSDKQALTEGDGWSYLTEEEQQEKQKDTIDPRLEKLKMLVDRNKKENKE